jgi:amino acid transporter
MTQHPALARRLGLPEAVGLSVAVVCPSVGMAFNVSLCAQAAGAAAPLSFLLGTAVMLVVATSFAAFSRRMPHAGAAYAFVAHAFGPWSGVVAGWTMLLAYFCFTVSMSALTADFIITALREAGLSLPHAGLPFACLTVATCGFLAWRDTRMASRLMLALEAFSMAAILFLAGAVLVRVNQNNLWTALPFTPHAAPGGLPAIGYGLVFAILSFAGFEGAATISEETENPRRIIPIAMIATLVASGLFFVTVSYAVVLGFGLSRMDALAASQAPLDELARVRIGPGFALMLDTANAISAFASVLGALTATVRVLFALGRGGLSTRLALIDPQHHTPARAIFLCVLASLAALCATLPFARPGDDYGYISTVATLALILVYGAVSNAEALEAAQRRRIFMALLGLAGVVALGWALLCSIVPVPPPPAKYFAPLVLAWVAAGLTLPLIKPRLRLRA